MMSVCEEYGPLISAMIDGELSADERGQVEEHLETCTSCQRRVEVFGELSRLVATERPTLPDEWPHQIVSRLATDRRRRRLRLVGYVTAAAVLLGLLGLPFVRQPQVASVAKNRPASVDSHSPAPAAGGDLLGPLETLQVVSRQEKRTYQAMRRLMTWDLRALKLELRQLDVPPERLEQLERRIDLLMKRVEQADHDSDEGESI